MSHNPVVSRLSLLSVLCVFISVISALNLSVVVAQTRDWCKELPRPEYKTLERVQVSDPWFEVYKVAPGTYAIYEPHQSEEVIFHLIVGKQKAIQRYQKSHQ